MKRMKRIIALVLTILIALSGVMDVLADGVKDSDFDYEQYKRWVNASKNAATTGDASEGMLMLGYTSAANVQLMEYSDSKIVKTNESIQSSGTAVVVLEAIDYFNGKLNLYQIRYNSDVYYVKQAHISLVNEVPACSCGNENGELKTHADSCSKKKYFHHIADLFTADELASVWDGFKADEKEHMLEYLSWTNQEKLEELKKQLNTTVTTEFEGMKLTIEGGRNVSVSGDAEIPAEAKELFEDKEDHWQFTLDIKADYNPNGVKISIGGLELDNQVEATVYHFFDSAEEIEEAEKRGANILKIGSSSYEVLPAYVDVEKGTVAFTAYTFSTYTVDFHYGENMDEVYSINGESSILLSELFAAIGYTEHSISDIVNVTFSNKNLLAVEPTLNDWQLTSLSAFSTNEELKITFSDGSTITLLVTDAYVYDDERKLGTGDYKVKLSWMEGISGVSGHLACSCIMGDEGKNKNFVLVLPDGTQYSDGHNMRQHDHLNVSSTSDKYWFLVTEDEDKILIWGDTVPGELDKVNELQLNDLTTAKKATVTIKAIDAVSYDNSQFCKVRMTSRLSKSSQTVYIKIMTGDTGTSYTDRGSTPYTYGERSKISPRLDDIKVKNITPYNGYILSPTTGNSGRAVSGSTYTIYLDSQCTVKLHSNYGTDQVTSKTMTFNQDLTGLPTYTRPGYTLIGWSKSKTATTSDTYFTADKIAKEAYFGKDTTTDIYAVWAPINYTLTFNANGGSINPNTLSYNITSKANLPKPNKDGFVFAGWKVTTPGGSWVSGNTYSDGTSVEGMYGNATLTAEWTYTKYTITYEANGGTLSGSSTQDYYCDTNVTLQAAAQKDKYKFAGWKFISGSTGHNWSDTTYSANQNVGTGKNGNIVLQAQWDALYQYKVIFHMASGDTNIPSNLDTGWIDEASKTMSWSKEPCRVDNVFAGWSYSDGGEIVIPAGTKSISLTGTASNTVTKDLYAVFYPNYTVKHMLQKVDGSGYEEKSDDRQVLNDVAGTQTRASAKAYNGFTAQAITQQTIKADGSTVVEVKYNRNQHQVTYSYSGKVPSDASALPSDAIKRYGENVAVAGTPTATGYTFSGWDTDDVTVTSGRFSMPDGNVAFIGSWTAKNDVSYTVKYIEKGTTNEIKTAKVVGNQAFDSEVTETAPAITGFTAVAPTSQTFTLDAYNKVITFYYTRNEYQVTYAYDGKVPAAAPEAPEAATKKFEDEVTVAAEPSVTGYTFSGWDTDDVTVEDGKFSMPDNDVAFIGSWTAKKDVSYTVKYMEQGTANEINTAKVVNNQTFDSEVTEEAAEITGFTAVAPTSQTFTLDAYNKVITFYYTRNEYKVTYAYDGKVPAAAPEAPEAATKKFEDEVTVAAEPSVTGYTFSGWDTDDVEVKSGKFSMPDSDVAFIGSWTAKDDVSYTVKYIEQGTTNEIKDAKEVTGQTFDREVTEEAAEIAGFTAVAPTSQTFTLDAYNKVITFYYTRNEYKVTYAYDGKVPAAAPEAPEAATKKFEDEVTVAAEPSVTGYTFSGWDTEDVTVTSGKFSMPDNDVAFIGSWTAKKDVSYTVKYIEQGTTNEIKDAKEVTGQTFDREVTEEAAEIAGFTAVAPTSQTFTLDAYNKVITFYYTRNEYKVTYAYDGKVPTAAPDAPEAATKKYADEVSVASDPSVTGYTFSGWDTDDVEVKSGKFSMPDSDVAFIGSWTAKDDVSYTVKYLEQGTDKEIRTAKVVDNQTFDSEVTETAPDITAYKVVEPDSQTITLDAYDKVIIFYYVHSEFTVSYSYVGEVPEGAPDAPEDSKEIATDTVEVADGPTMIGYTFSGWETDDVTVTEGTFIMPSGDVEFYGSWSANEDVSYTVKYIEQGTDFEIMDAKKVENMTFNIEVTEDAPTITGFTAVEPTSQTVKLDEYDKEITFYYTRNQHKLTYVVEGDDPSADKEVDYFFGDEIEDYEPAQQYFDFSGWYTDSDLTLEWTQPETMPDENITVYGKFVRQEAKLVITKSGMKSGENAIFTVTGNGFSMTVVIPGNDGSVTIAGLNVGETYTITESADWSWRYKSTAAKSVQIVLDGENKAEFVNSPTDTQKWLDDESSAHNVLTAGGEQK